LTKIRLFFGISQPKLSHNLAEYKLRFHINQIHQSKFLVDITLYSGIFREAIRQQKICSMIMAFLIHSLY